MELKTIFSSDDGINLKEKGHFGDSNYFLVYLINEKDSKLLKKIKNSTEEDENEIHGDEKKAKSISNILKDANLLASIEFGPNIVKMLKKFSCVILKTSSIDTAIKLIQKNLNQIKIENEKGEKRKALILKEN